MRRARTSGLAIVTTLLVLGAVGVALARADDTQQGSAYLEPTDSFLERHNLNLTLDDRMHAMVMPGDKRPLPDVRKEPEAPPPPPKGPPLPLHTLEGTSGGAMTGMAYFANAGPPGTTIGMPSASYTFLVAGSKHVHSIAISEVLFRRIELSYAWNRIDLGSFPNDVEALTGLTIRDHVYLHNFNVRGILIEENSFDLPLPQIVGGVHFKFAQGLDQLDGQAGHGPSSIGYDDEDGVDFTLMASKTWQDPCLKRPLITSLGVRFTRSSQLGWLGFGDDYKANLEANIAWVPTDWLAVAYEFRQKRDQYDTIPHLVKGEDNWHTILVAWLINDRASLAAVYGHLGDIANTTENRAFGLQFKYEF